MGKPPPLSPTFCFLQKMPFQKQLPLRRHCSSFLTTQLSALSPTQTLQFPALSPWLLPDGQGLLLLYGVTSFRGCCCSPGTVLGSLGDWGF